MFYWSCKIEILKQRGKGQSVHSLRIIDMDLASEAVNQKDPFESRDVKIIFIIISPVWIQDTAGGEDLTLTDSLLKKPG